jgi:hypothetical protein
VRGWRAEPETVTQRVWGPHPVQISQPLDMLFGLSMSGVDPMRRGEAQSSFNGSRFNGDLGPLQSFGRIYGFNTDMIRARKSSLPSANGASGSASPMLDLLGATTG